MGKDDKREYVNIKEFNPQIIPISSTWMIIGKPGSGKSSFIENMLYYNKHKYPVGRGFFGSETSYNRFKRIMGDIFVTNHYSESELKEAVIRQKELTGEYGGKWGDEYGKKDYRNGSVIILDDVATDPKIFKSELMNTIFKNSSQHGANLVMIGTQYAIDFPPALRTAVSYIALFREPNTDQREKLYKNFGGACGSKQNFNDLMDTLTGDYTCMIINQRTQSNGLEDCVYYYKGKDPEKAFGNWKFGCEEYREWNKQRFNTSYKDNFII